MTIVSTLVGDVDSSVFAVIHLLWLNLIMDIFAAAALATDSPPDDILKRQPEPRGRHIVSPTMWKMIFGQAVYQLVVIFTLHYAGHSYFGSDRNGYQYQAFILNTYIMLQVFNQWKYVVHLFLPQQTDNPNLTTPQLPKSRQHPQHLHRLPP